MKNGKIDKVLFDGGYAQATAVNKTTKDKFAFYYYNQDHLGNNREVVNAKGVVQQVTNYYPFGAPYADATAVKGANLQPYKYNGKELDLMHGLNTYDYGARQHDPIIARWDRIDPLSEKYYNVSPYNYCHNNPVMMVDPDGKDDYTLNDKGYLEFWRRSNAKATDRIYAANGEKITINKDLTQQMLSKRTDYDGNYVSGGTELTELYEFCAKNTGVEWALNVYNTDGKSTAVLMTSHDKDGVSVATELAGMKESDLIYRSHSHIYDTAYNPSGFASGDVKTERGEVKMFGDRLQAWKISNRFESQGKKAPSFSMYHPASNSFVYYNKNRITGIKHHSPSIIMLKQHTLMKK